MTEYEAARRKKKNWRIAVSCLAVVVVIATTSALVLPAITLEGEKTAYCGFEEHEHTEDCYEDVLICGFEEAAGESEDSGTAEAAETATAHTHDESCYETREVLICGQEEAEAHVHSQDCYTLVQGALTCESEDEEHEHTDDCYAWTEELTCGLEESEGHTHTADCYETQTVLTCGLEESDGNESDGEEPADEDPATEAAEGHIHTEDCYETQLTCDLEEHEHTLACYANPEADVETAADWEATFSGVELTGVWADDLLAIAETQLGYTESTENYIVQEDGETIKGYTRYGAWYGEPYGDWCAMFVSFCLSYAGIPADYMPRNAACQTWVDTLASEEWGLYVDAADYIPTPGDLVFFDWDGDGKADHVGIVAEYTEAALFSGAKIKTIEGNSGDRVQYVTYSLDDEAILGYAMLPESQTTLTVEGEGYIITVTYGPEAALPRGVELTASEYPEDDETYVQRYAEAAEFYEWDEDSAMDFRLFDISLCADGEEVEPAAPVQVAITFPEEESDEDRTVTHFSDEEGMEPETLETVTTYDYEESVQTVEFEAESFTDYAVSAANPQYTIQHYLSFSKVKVAELAGTSGTWLPFINTSSHTAISDIYTVKDTKTDTDWSLTSAGLENGVSEDKLSMLYVELNADGSLATEREYVSIFMDETAEYKSKLQLQYMSRMYEDEETFNKNYQLEAVWVYQPSESEKDDFDPSALTEESNWLKYKIETTADSVIRDYTSQIHFTNNPDNPNITKTVGSDGYVTANSNPTDDYPYKYTVLIQSGTVVRLVYTATEGTYGSNVNFFDYDITDGYVYATASDAADQTNRIATSTTINNTTTVYYANSTASGINSSSNYVSSVYSSGSIHYAFGNTNAGVDESISKTVWNGNVINAANQTKNGSSNDTYQGLTFGLVSGLTTGSLGLPRVSFSSGIITPNLFGADDSTSTGTAYVAGKTSYVTGQYSLSFDRVGGTYTLSSVLNVTGNITTASGLTTFKNTAGNVWSNEFWPMDNAASHGTNGHDLLFGSKLRSSTGGLARYGSGTYDVFPISDIASAQSAGTDTYNHNAYFGMSYSVEFTLKPGYCAPLAYWFYGDDDMWVFLEEVNADGTGSNAKLIADVGGVHSSVGEFVNLWDYIDPIDYTTTTTAEDGTTTTVENSSQTYRLTIFYTERGASGSTCYMRFTLPLDDQELTAEAADQVIVIEKELIDDDGNAVAYDSNSNEEFEFLLKIRDSNGQPTYDMYDYTIYNRVSNGTDTVATDEDGNELKGTIASSTDGNTFKLKGGQYVVVSGLYTDRYYIVTEEKDDSQAYLTSMQYGVYDSDTGEISDLGDVIYDIDSSNEQSSTSTSNYNYVLFTNSPARKVEITPGNEQGVNVGEEIVYEIQWANDTNKDSASITVTDVLDEGVDFVAADFRATTTIGSGDWQLTASDSDSGTLTYDGSAASPSGVIYGTITYNPETHTVTWTLTADTRASGTVSLKVKVNEKGLDLAEGETVATVDNQAKVTINETSLTTNWVTNPVWEPVKTETSPGEGETVEYNDTITYQVTWKNFLLEDATVSVLDPLDKGADYVTDSAKAYIYDPTNDAADEDGYVELITFTDEDGEEIINAISYDKDKHQLTWNLGVQSSGVYGYVEFTVKVNADGVQQDEIENQGFVTVGNRSELETNIIKNPTPRITLTINKVGQSGSLTGAQFLLYYTTTSTDSESNYYYCYQENAEEVSWVDTVADSTVLETGNDGSVTAYQLVPGMTYYLEEI